MYSCFICLVPFPLLYRSTFSSLVLPCVLFVSSVFCLLCIVRCVLPYLPLCLFICLIFVFGLACLLFLALLAGPFCNMSLMAVVVLIKGKVSSAYAANATITFTFVIVGHLIIISLSVPGMGAPVLVSEASRIPASERKKRRITAEKFARRSRINTVGLRDYACS